MDHVRDAPTADPLLVETVDRLLGDVSTQEVVQQAEADGWAPAVWEALAEAGLPWISVPTEAGGSGGTVTDACTVLRGIGRHAAPVPLAETGLLGGWLLGSGGLQVPDGPVTVVPGRPGDSVGMVSAGSGWALSGRAHNVAWASKADRIAALIDVDGTTHIASIPTTNIKADDRRALSGEPRQTVDLDGIVLDTDSVAVAPDGVDREALAVRGALSRVNLMAGAGERIRDITVQYAHEREQFGRAIARFQAVQIHLVRCAEEAANVAMAADTATASFEVADAMFEVGAAKCLASDLSKVITKASHQAHGAIGMTQEYLLHQYSRRLWTWREEYGNAEYWAGRIGQIVAGHGADRLWPLITAGSAELAGTGG